MAGGVGGGSSNLPPTRFAFVLGLTSLAGQLSRQEIFEPRDASEFESFAAATPPKSQRKPPAAADRNGASRTT